MPFDEHFLELICAEEGEILEVRRCDPDLARAPVKGGLVSELVDSGSIDKARRFLSRLQQNDRVYDWELNLPVQGQASRFHFAGHRESVGYWIVGASSRRGLLSLLERGRAPGVRGSAREDRAMVAGDDRFALAEMSRMNNELVNLHREVAKQASELARLNLRKNQLLGMAAHDLRNPVAAIHAYSELLESELSPSLDSERLEFLTTIKSLSKFMLELVNDLVDFAAIEAGELRLRRANVDLVSLLRNCLSLNRVLAAKKQLDVRFATDVAHSTVEVDAHKVQQVVDNLMTNAIKFSPRGGVIEVRVRHEGERVVVSVSDQGPGVAPHEMEQLFLPFHRVDKGGEDAAGSGLGLAICRRIVEGHGGEIWVTSEPEEGAVFSFSMPTLRPPTSTST